MRHRNLFEDNYAFIDSQNFYQGIKKLGWNIDWKKLRVYLKDKYRITTAYVFIGYVESFGYLYEILKRSGYILVYKETIKTKDGKIKGNVDVDLTLKAMIEKDNFTKALIVSNDGDFSPLVQYLCENDKLKGVLASSRKDCSYLLRKLHLINLVYASDIKKKIEKRKSPARGHAF